MIRQVRVTKFAEAALADIAGWTVENFGPAQADRNSDELIKAFAAIASGEARGRSCRALLPGVPDDLRYSRSGRHFIIYRSFETFIDILDLLHVRSDMATRLHDIAERD